jgi:hypothetical protein
LKTDYVIAHSVGSLIALYNFKLHKNFKLILVNPVIFKKNLLINWLKFITHEGLPKSFRKSFKIRKLILALIKLFKYFKLPIIDVLNQIPPDNLVIIYGQKDKYLFDNKLLKIFKDYDFKIIRVDGAAHNYENNLKEAVNNLIYN